MMVRILGILALVFIGNSKSEDIEYRNMLALQVNSLFVINVDVFKITPPFLVDREIRIASCSDDYIRSESKSYTKKIKNNLYDLLHELDKVASKIHGKGTVLNDVPYSDKIESLARIQCEIYYDLGFLK